MYINSNEIIFITVVILSNIIQAITGFAGTLLAMPVSIFLIGIESASCVLSIVAMVSCIFIILKNYKYTNMKELKKILIYMCIGMVIGIKLINLLPLNFILKLYSIFVIFIAVCKLSNKCKVKKSEFSNYIILIASGIMHGLFVSGGALLVIYITDVLKDKKEFVATVAPVWIILNTLLAINYYIEGFYTKNNINLILITIIPTIIAVKIGDIIRNKISLEKFLTLSYILLIISGVTLLM